MGKIMRSCNRLACSKLAMPATLAVTLVATLVVVAGISMPGVARAQSASIDKRIDRIERQLNAVQRKVFGGGSMTTEPGEATAAPSTLAPQNASTAAAIEVRLSGLESQLRQVTGQAEEANFKIRQLDRKLDKFMQDVQFRLNALEGNSPGTAATGTTTPADNANSALDAQGNAPATASDDNMIPSNSDSGQSGSPDANTGILPTGDAASQYDAAYTLLAAGKYAEAEAGFKAFLERFPKDDLASNAQYWLAQSYYVRGNYDKAARAFLDGYQKYPKSSKAAAYLLKIGITLNKIGQSQDACDVFHELSSQYPSSPESKNRRPAAEKEAGCR